LRGEDRGGSGLAGRLVKIFPAQCRRPGIEPELAVGPVDLGQQVEQGVGVERQVVMVLDGDGDAVLRRAVAHFANDVDDSPPERGRIAV
jgi:hypothetical protein